VVYGVVGYKAHAKLMLVVRREAKRLRRYVHLGTGNYHPGTARSYTDFSLLTADRVIGEDVHKAFMQMTGLGKVARLRKLLHSPFTLQRTLIALIDAEAERARHGRTTGIRAKMNSLAEPGIIKALYRASQAGVPHRPRGARRLLPAARRARHLRVHPRPLDRRPLPRAQPRLVLPRRRRGTDLPVLRRLDGAQLLSAASSAPSRSRTRG